MDSQVEFGQPRQVINTENLIRYLQGFRTTESGEYMGGRMEDFARSIDVGTFISHTISEMYAAPRFNEAGNEQLEQGKIVYAEINTNQIKATSSAYGTANEINFLPLKQEVATNRGVGVLEIHDHPGYGGLFTPPDYISMIFGNTRKKLRAINGIMILCPGMQVMALATDETPIFDYPLKANEFVNTRMVDIRGQEEQAIKEDLADLQTEVNNRASIELIGHVLTQAGRGDIVGQALQVANKRVDAAIKESFDKHYRVDNTLLVSLANELRVKLYFSTDMRNFKEFSA